MLAMYSSTMRLGKRALFDEVMPLEWRMVQPEWRMVQPKKPCLVSSPGRNIMKSGTVRQMEFRLHRINDEVTLSMRARIQGNRWHNLGTWSMPNGKLKVSEDADVYTLIFPNSYCEYYKSYFRHEVQIDCKTMCLLQIGTREMEIVYGMK